MRWCLLSFFLSFYIFGCIEFKSDVLTGPQSKISHITLLGEEVDNLDLDSVLLRRSLTSGYISKELAYSKYCNIMLDGNVEYFQTNYDPEVGNAVSETSTDKISDSELTKIKNILFGYQLKNQISVNGPHNCIADGGINNLIARISQNDPTYIYLLVNSLEDKSSSNSDQCYDVSIPSSIELELNKILDKYCLIK